MATKLTSPLTRESTETSDDREILVTLCEDQKISLKLKGMKSGTVSIGIKELWDQLKGAAPERPKKDLSKATIGEIMIPLSRLRSVNWVTPGQIHLAQRMDELLTHFAKETNEEKTT